MEESPAEGSKTKLIIVSVIVIILVIASLGIYLMGNGASGITAMEGREIADEVAYEWNNSAELVEIRSLIMDNKGYSSGWLYVYASSTEIEYSATGLEVSVLANKSYTINEIPHPPSFIPISNWVLNSPEIVETAKLNSEISSFLSQYSDARITSMALVGQNESDLKCLWTIEWADAGLMDNPHWIRIRLNGETGEVYDVDT